MNGFCYPSSGRIQCRRCIIETGGLNGGTHHANLNDNCCDTGPYRRNRSRQCGSSRSLVRLSSSLLPSSSLRLLPLPSPSLLRLSPLLPSSLLPSALAPRVLGRSFFSSCIAVAASGCRASDKAGVALRYSPRSPAPVASEQLAAERWPGPAGDGRAMIYGKKGLEI